MLPYSGMKVLAFETSCDETGIALVTGQKIGEGFVFTTEHAALLSQAHLHAPYGGVYPNLAKREHQLNLPVLYEQFKDQAADAVAVTVGPGLEPALWQGIEFAKKVAQERGVPLIPTNHMEAHLLSSLVQKNELKDIELPVLALLISGGHTEFVLMRDWFQYEIVGQTLDDAVGECFDKVARMLGLPYPGGPHISRIASQHRQQGDTLLSGSKVSPWKLPRPMIDSGTCDVSFSGLKTAALYALRDPDGKTPSSNGAGKKLSDEEKAAFAAEFEEAVSEVFVRKTHKALTDTGAKTFVIGGGVAANAHIREKLQELLQKEFPNVEIRLPDPAITGDNAVMIAQCALARVLGDKKGPENAELKAVGNLSIAS